MEDPTDHLSQKLNFLKSENSVLAAHARDLASEIRELRERRDRLNAEFKSAISQSKGIKAARDSVNEQVQEIKSQRDTIKQKVREKVAQLRTLRNEEAALETELGVSELTKEIQRLEWKIQTNPLSVHSEKQLIGQVQQLEKHLAKATKRQELSKRIVELRSVISTLRREEENVHQLMLSKVKEGEPVHTQLVSKSREIEEIKRTADDVHNLLMQKIREIREVRENFVRNLGQIANVRNEIRSLVESRKTAREKQFLERMEKEASEKLEKGEKISLQEFKALMQKGRLSA